MRRRGSRLTTPATLLGLTLTLTLTAGCEEPMNTGAKPSTSVATRPPAKKLTDDDFIVGRRTQDIRKVPDEQKKGANVIDKPRITSKDPITIQGNAYVSIIGQAAILNIKHAIDLYRATNDRYPKDIDEFMNEIIKPNNIALPKLPYYQEYGYDEKEHKLVILEYPDRKDNPPQ